MMVLRLEWLPLPFPEKVRVLVPKRGEGVGIAELGRVRDRSEGDGGAADVVQTVADVDRLPGESSLDGRTQVEVSGAADPDDLSHETRG